ncbi:hypothetical protein [Gluconobacter kondonii]|uniref:hypothetical protein n=1 Tax=Gluconobacter kondonii TaxID=941463 RepID=UPI001B8C8925|nr:hypothetical protein [Gluconobacter kondonii]MBS1057179.1 hypothetical protein [Gluconobacter kondonii]
MTEVITKAVAGSNVIAPALHDGELRILDTDLATRLGFAKPENIRKLIERHNEALSVLGLISTVEINTGQRGRPGKATYLNKKQAIFITAKSETAEATEITIEIIEKFDAYERGELPVTPQPSLTDRQSKAIALLRVAEDEAATFIRKRVNEAVLVMQGVQDAPAPSPASKVTAKQVREAVGLFRSLQYVNKLSGMDKNNALLSANRQVKETTGIDLLKNSGATHLLTNETDHPLTPTAIGKRIGNFTPRQINGALAFLNFQVKKSIGKDDAWVPTSKGEPFAVMEDTGKKHSDGTPVRQLKWKATVIPLIEKEVTAGRPFAKKPEPAS